jgi:hypothetical protein
VTTFSEIYDKLVSGTVGNWLAIVGVLSLIYWAWRIVSALQHREHGSPQATTAPAAVLTAQSASAEHAPGEQSASRTAAPVEDIAVIAAAVHAILGVSRIIHLEADHAGQTWAIEGRWMQQTSHKPR